MLITHSGWATGEALAQIAAVLVDKPLNRRFTVGAMKVAALLAKNFLFANPFLKILRKPFPTIVNVDLMRRLRLAPGIAWCVHAFITCNGMDEKRSQSSGKDLHEFWFEVA